ncbi:MAG: nitroreductase family protein [Lachnospiraceae bacterium]|nr:nitroreductase family protein [Lachnospiraceae bacterium]MBR0402196.1 nitroreductase family protein [Lachnospiraceae bacterium]
MEYTDILNERKSIRAYDASKKVTAEQVKEMVEAAILAPSWKNFQSARYYAALSDEMIAKVASECLPEFNARSTQGAAYIVTTFVKGQAGHNMEGVPDNELGDCWGCYDAGLHNENLVLKATELGLGTLIMGIRDEAACRRVFAIPEEETIMAVIAVGYPAQEPPRRPRKTPEEILKVF